MNQFFRRAISQRRRIFLELGHFDLQQKKGPAGKNLGLFLLEKLENCILNKKFNPQMVTIRALFPQIRAFYSSEAEGIGAEDTFQKG